MLFNTTISWFKGFESESPDNWLMYLMYGLIVAFVSAESIYYLVKSLRRAKKLNMDMGKIKKVMTTSATFSVLPAIGIGLGVVTLIGILGIAVPAIRLSVVGSLQYETQVADGVATAITTKDGVTGSLAALINQGVTPQDYVTITLVMTLAIIAGNVLIVLFYKKLQPQLTKLGKLNLSAGGGNQFLEEKKLNIGDLAFQIAFIGMIIGYLSMAVSTIFSTTTFTYSDFTTYTFKNMFYTYGYYNLIAVVVAAGVMWVFDILINKVGWKWLDSFSIALSMIIAMIVVAIIAYFAQQNGWDPTLYETAPATEQALSLIL